MLTFQLYDSLYCPRSRILHFVTDGTLHSDDLIVGFEKSPYCRPKLLSFIGGTPHSDDTDVLRTHQIFVFSLLSSLYSCYPLKRTLLSDHANSVYSRCPRISDYWSAARRIIYSMEVYAPL